MLQNYLKTALRNLWRKKGSTLINISGLSLGIAGSVIISLIIFHHTSFDDFHSKGDRIYRVVWKSKGNDGDRFNGGIPNVLPAAFKNDFPEAEEVVFTSYRSGTLVTIPQGANEPAKKYTERKGVVYTEPSFFRVFDRRVLVGDPIKGLDEPNEVVISKGLALKYFNREDVIGEIVRHDNIDYKITAVVEDAPSNTDFPFDLFLSYSTIQKKSEENGGWNSVWSDEQCYFLLKEGETTASMEARFPEFAKKYLGEDAERTSYSVQPMSTIHSDDRYGNYNYNTVTAKQLTTWLVIAVFLVVTACINFVNLATAEAIKRSKEVGIRKSLGSSRAQLIAQFLGETGLVTVFSVVLAVGLTWLGLRYLNPFLGESLSLNDNPVIWTYLGVITVVVSLLSGLYPSFVVSAFNPVLALKNAMATKSSSGYNLRRGLVVVQFFISQVFIIGTLVLINQMEYLNRKDLGFSKDAIVNIPIPDQETPAGADQGNSKMRTLREQVAALSGVVNASVNSTPPSSNSVAGTRFRIEGKDEDFRTQVKEVDGHYAEVFRLTTLVGEGLKDLDTAQGFVINEKAAEVTGYSPTEIIGKQINMWGKRLPVVGVLKNFHTVSLSEPIRPVVLLNRIRGYQNLSVKLNASDMQSTIKEIEKYWAAAYPDAVFSFRFMDEEIRSFYETEQRTSVLLGVFASLAIFIGCLGLFGLATFMANQKTKEIGIRKVLGATVSSIVMIFSKEFALLILGGFVFAVPVAWYFLNEFLSGFEYKVELGPAVFLIGMGLSILIAFVTVGYRSFRAATVNPVDSLKCE